MGAADGSVYAKHLARVGDHDVPYLKGGRGDPLIYLHGMGGGGKWESFHMALANDTLTYAPVLPGWQDWQPPTGIHSVADYAAVVAGLLDSLDLPRVTLAGHSIGAWIALHVAERHPERVDRLILVDALGLATPSAPAVSLDKLDEEEFGKRLLARLGLIASAQPYGFGAQFTNARTSPEFERQWKGRGLVCALANGSYTDAGLHAGLAGIAAETLIIWGEHDGLALPEHARLLHDSVAASRLIFVQDAGHLPMVERKETFHRICRDFLVGVQEQIAGTVLA